MANQNGEMNNLLFEADYLKTVISFLFGFFSAVFAEPLRRWLFKPELALSFEDSKDCIAHTPLRPSDSYSVTEAYGIFVRVRATNRRRILAKNCRAYLVNIEKKTDESFSPTIYSDSIPLPWACKDAHASFIGFDLAKGLNQYIDILLASDDPLSNGHKSYWKPLIPVNIFRYETFFRELYENAGIYRLTVQVVSDNAEPAIIKLTIEWNGHWQTIKVQVE